jgi:hypothetical protein
LKSFIRIGKITTYTNNELHIQYRGNKIPLYHFENAKQFRKEEVFWGINKEVTEKNIVCRIMPVMSNGGLKWIGIYLKCAALNN